MKLKSIGLVISDGDLYFKSSYESEIKPKQMDNLVTKFNSVFSRLNFKATIHLPKDSGKAQYIIKKRIKSSEVIPEEVASWNDDYLTIIRECNRKVKEIVETITKIEEEIQRFELIKEVADVSIQS